MSIQIFFLIAVPAWLLMVSAPPRNFLGLCGVGRLLYLLLAMWLLVGAAFVWRNVGSSTWKVLSVPWIVVLLAGAIGSFFWPTEVNFRKLLFPGSREKGDRAG